MAVQATRVARFRSLIREVRQKIRDLTDERQAIVDEGAAAWLNAADPPLDGITTAEIIAAANAVQAINDTLEANNRAHEKALTRAEA